jgi:hypothetical protein
VLPSRRRGKQVGIANGTAAGIQSPTRYDFSKLRDAEEPRSIPFLPHSLMNFFKRLFSKDTAPAPIAPQKQPAPAAAQPPPRKAGEDEDITLLDPVSKDAWAAENAKRQGQPPPRA